MPKLITKFSGLLSAFSIGIAILVGVFIGLGIAFAIIIKVWG